MRPARAVSFDLDGTLYAVPRARVAWRLRRERGLLVALMAARERMRHEAPLADREALIAREVELVAPSFRLHASEARARLVALHAALPAALTRGVAPYPEVRAAIEGAAARGLRIAVLSDYEPGDKLRFLGLDDLPWACVLGCDALGALKPHGRAFLALAERLGVAPDEVVHVGDREDLDVAGARAAGLRAWRFGRVRGGTEAEHVVPTWRADTFHALSPRA